jgi:hypothetical protein
MARLKKKYPTLPEPQSVPAPAPCSEPSPYSMDLKVAAKHTGYSVWALRQAIVDGKLSVVNLKPYIIRRVDLEKFVDQGLQKVA